MAFLVTFERYIRYTETKKVAAFIKPLTTLPSNVLNHDNSQSFLPKVSFLQ